jgi:hypothetical protein
MKRFRFSGQTGIFALVLEQRLSFFVGSDEEPTSFTPVRTEASKVADQTSQQ